MKKFGFTLSELLITVGIVGVVAALTAPAVSNIMPDRNKMMFMKNYKELTTITEKLLQDPELYYTTYTLDADGKKVPTCVGLACDTYESMKTEHENVDFNSIHKYGYLLANYLGVDMDNNFGGNVDSCNFTTDSGVHWAVYNDSSDALEQVHITLDADEQGKVYDNLDEKEVKKCKSYLFNIDQYGAVTPADSLSKAYLLNPNNMNNKKKDLACAKAIKADTVGKSPADICAELDD